MIRTRHTILRALVAGALAAALAACADGPTAPNVAPEVSLRRVGTNETADALIACPASSSASASAVIGPRGGRLEVQGFALIVPPHAVPHPTRFILDVPASQYLEVEIHTPDHEHYEFRRQVQVTLDYSRCPDVGRSISLQAWNIDSSTKQLIEPMRSRNERGRHRLVFWTDHLSGYALAD